MYKLIFITTLIISISAFAGESNYSDYDNNLRTDVTRNDSSLYNECITEVNRKHFKVKFDICINEWKANNKASTNKTTPEKNYREELLKHVTICKEQAIREIEEFRKEENTYLRCEKYK